MAHLSVKDGDKVVLSLLEKFVEPVHLDVGVNDHVVSGRADAIAEDTTEPIYIAYITIVAVATVSALESVSEFDPVADIGVGTCARLELGVEALDERRALRFGEEFYVEPVRGLLGCTPASDDAVVVVSGAETFLDVDADGCGVVVVFDGGSFDVEVDNGSITTSWVQVDLFDVAELGVFFTEIVVIQVPDADSDL